MNYRLASLVSVILALTVSPAWSAPLTLKECISQAVVNNPFLKNAAWDSKIAQENVRLASAAYFPKIDAQTGYSMQLEPQAVIIGGRTTETQEADFGFAGLSASYTIYDFGRRDSRKRQSEAVSQASSRTFESQKSDVTLRVIETYFSILESGKLIIAAEEEVALVDEHRRVAKVLFEEGVVTRNDLLQAEVRLAAARQKLLVAKNRRENFWLLLNFLIGSKPDNRAELDEKTVMAEGAAPTTDSQLQLDARNDIIALRHGAEARELEVKESKGNFFPEIYSRLALDYVQNAKVREQAIMSATIGLKINLFDGYASTAAREKAIKNSSKSLDTLRLAEEQARLEINTARNDVAVAKERISVTEAAIRQSEENLRINRERYQERVGTATEVMDAQTLVTQSKTDYQRAFYDHQTAIARLLWAQGQL
ncbi:MAG: TolC family protein [Deltaproteobacteria bacterium]|nr:TolC family protein [Deltaproteobacteria bacterium]